MDDLDRMFAGTSYAGETAPEESSSAPAPIQPAFSSQPQQPQQQPYDDLDRMFAGTSVAAPPPAAPAAADTVTGGGEFARGLYQGGFEQNAEAAINTLDMLGVKAGNQGMQDEAERLRKQLKEFGAAHEKDLKLAVPGLQDIHSWTDLYHFAAGQLGQMVGSSGPSLLASVGIGMATSEMGPEVSVPAALGTAFGVSYLQNTPNVYADLVQAGVDKNTAVNFAGIAGAPIAGLDAFSEKIPILGALGHQGLRTVQRAVLKRIVQEAGKNATVEGLTEAMQQVIQDATTSLASGKAFGTKEQLLDWANNFAGGAIGGAAFGGAAGLRPDKLKTKPGADLTDTGDKTTASDTPPEGAPAGDDGLGHGQGTPTPGSTQAATPPPPAPGPAAAAGAARGPAATPAPGPVGASEAAALSGGEEYEAPPEGATPEELAQHRSIADVLRDPDASAALTAGQAAAPTTAGPAAPPAPQTAGQRTQAGATALQTLLSNVQATADQARQQAAAATPPAVTAEPVQAPPVQPATPLPAAPAEAASEPAAPPAGPIQQEPTPPAPGVTATTPAEEAPEATPLEGVPPPAAPTPTTEALTPGVSEEPTAELPPAEPAAPALAPVTEEAAPAAPASKPKPKKPVEVKVEPGRVLPSQEAAAEVPPKRAGKQRAPAVKGLLKSELTARLKEEGASAADAGKALDEAFAHHADEADSSQHESIAAAARALREPIYERAKQNLQQEAEKTAAEKVRERAEATVAGLEKAREIEERRRAGEAEVGGTGQTKARAGKFKGKTSGEMEKEDAETFERRHKRIAERQGEEAPQITKDVVAALQARPGKGGARSGAKAQARAAANQRLTELKAQEIGEAKAREAQVPTESKEARREREVKEVLATEKLAQPEQAEEREAATQAARVQRDHTEHDRHLAEAVAAHPEPDPRTVRRGGADFTGMLRGHLVRFINDLTARLANKIPKTREATNSKAENFLVEARKQQRLAKGKPISDNALYDLYALKRQMEDPGYSAAQFFKDLQANDQDSEYHQAYNEGMVDTEGNIPPRRRLPERAALLRDLLQRALGTRPPAKPTATDHGIEDAEGNVAVVPAKDRHKLGDDLKAFEHPSVPRTGEPTSLFGWITKRLNQRLMEFAHDMPVYWVDPDEYDRITKNRRSAAMWLEPSVVERARGAKGTIIIRKGMTDLGTAASLRHEGMHALTLYAIQRDLNGIGGIARELHAQLKQDFGHLDHYGLTDAEEMMSEAFTNEDFQNFLASTPLPQHLADKIIGMGRTGTYWDAIVSAVAHVVNLFNAGRPGMTYLDAIMRIAEPGFRQDDTLRSHAVQLYLDAATPEERADVRAAQASHFIDIGHGPRPPGLRNEVHSQMAPTPQGVQQQAEAYAQDLQRKAEGAGQSLRRGIDKFKSVPDIAAASVRWLGRESNPFYKALNAMRRAPSMATKLMETGDALVSRIYSRREMTETQMGDVQDVAYEATQHNVDPSIELKDNKHLTGITTGEGFTHAQQRAAHKRLRDRYQKWTPAQQKLFRDVGKFYKDFQNQMARELIRSKLAEASNRGVAPTLPPGKTMQDLEDWMMDGGFNKALKDNLDRREAQAVAEAAGKPYTPAPLTENEQYEQGLGQMAPDFKGATTLMLKQGFFVPLTRNGNHVVVSKLKIPTADGGIRAGDQLVFTDQKKLMKFLQGFEGPMAQPVKSYYYDPVTGKQTLKNEAGAKRAFIVSPQLQSFEVFENHADAVKRRDEMLQDPTYESVNDKTIRAKAFEHAGREILPSTAQRLIENSVKGITDPILAGQIRHSMTAAVFQTMAGSRIQQRRLKRRNVVGFNRDMARAMADYNVSASNYIAKLRTSPEINAAMMEIDRVVKERESRHTDGSGQRLRELKNALENHITANNQYDPSSTATRVANIAATVSYMDHLGSASTMMINMLQTAMMTMPQLSGRFGALQAFGALNRAYGKVGRLNMAKLALGNLGRAGKAFVTGQTARTDYGAMLQARLKDPGEKALIAELTKYDSLLGSIQGREAAPSELRKNVFEKYLGRGAEILSAVSGAIEFVNRSTTALAAYELATKNGMNQEQATNFATDAIDRTQGDYSKEMTPIMMKGFWGKTALQFKKYPLLITSTLGRNVGDAVAHMDPKERKVARKQLAYTALMHASLAGVFGGVPFIEGAKLIALLAQWLGLTDDDWQDYENKSQAMFNALIGNRMSEALVHGLPRLIGIDLSGRVGLDSLLTFSSPQDPSKDSDLKSWLWDLTSGAPMGMMLDIGTAIRNNDPTKLPVPKVFKDIYKGVTGYGTEKLTSTGRPIVGSELSLPESIWQGMGFQPAKRAEAFEAGGTGALVKEKKKVSAERSREMAPWLAARTPVDRQAAWTRIQDYNAGKTGKDRITRADLLRNKARRDKEDAATRKYIGSQ